MARAYHHPADDAFSDRIHTTAGVRSLIEQSQLMELLTELEQDGHDVSGPRAELVALVNYVSSAHVSIGDVVTHLDYCAERIKGMLK
ncbi:hypothetical protein DZA65_03182 [Dickeya dianthicola]|uniref:hypothetical protein n=1 Tax=Dickeya dianthicola TaxID=204039 RepID=UPI000CD499F0|nr:hypothetical protein [Dickeya dianthicola]AYC20057.1 hypothetical protein DZA65_03182 [Dickeya dianthicola]MBI0437104.1 hypothetical protein [Dickeya dianthicola]MBI0448638.1 hypothetical protein [Dickeya dianthicola]MBI0452065.1 hypothetical protein [Dickeya dianthicola]MBI0456357.1 hypothetical protein [Dickeya dianthicola]